MKLVPLYAAVLALFYVALSVRTTMLRAKLRIGVGDAGNAKMLRAMRVHANFAEYAPLALLLIYFAEMQGAASGFIHLVAVCLVAGRVLHAYGVSQVAEKLIFRQAGMLLTFASLLLPAGWLLRAAI